MKLKEIIKRSNQETWLKPFRLSNTEAQSRKKEQVDLDNNSIANPNNKN